MADPVLELDAAGSNIDGTNPGTAMLLVDASTGWGLTAFDAPQPELKLLWTSSIDTDGARRADPGSYENRTVTASLECERSTAALLQAQLRILGTKIGKIAHEGGTLKVTYPSGNSFIFDLLAGSHNIQFDHAFVLGNLAQVTVTFTALPGARGAEQDLGDNTETTLPALIFTEASIPGDLPALGRLVIDDDAGADQARLVWGVESNPAYTHTTSSGSGALFYEAESRTVLGGATAVAGPSGASGAGSNVIRQSALTNYYQGMLSTQASGGGSHLTHVGAFRVFARVQVPSSNAGTVSLAWEWSQGDFRRSIVNVPVEFKGIIDPRRAQWVFADLGQVTLSAPGSGAQRWEGRIIAKSTVVNDSLDVDYILFVPADWASGEARNLAVFPAPATLSARDEFNQTAGNLTGKTLPVGGTWTGAGSATDLTINTTNKTATRSTVADAGTGRFAIAGTATFTNVAVQVDNAVTGTTYGGYQGLIARYTNTSTYAYFRWNSEDGLIYLLAVSAGVNTLYTATTDPAVSASWYTLRLVILSSGAWHIYHGPQGQAREIASGWNALFATGGALASGNAGFYDEGNSGTSTREYDNFSVWVPAADAAVFASQSLEVRHDGVRREDSAGAIWTSVSSYEGDYLRVPPAGAEGRSVRCVAKGCRADMVDPAIDDISARLFVTPLYLNVPSA